MNRPESDPFGGRERIQGTWINGVLVQPGSSVCLRPPGKSDPEQRAQRGKVASVDSIEVDYEGKVVVAVVLENASGAEAPAAGEPGRKFYFRTDEIEPLPDAKEPEA